MINNAEKRVDASFEKMWKLKFGHVFLSSLFVQTLSTRFGQYFEVECFVEVIKLNLGQDSEVDVRSIF